MVKTTRVRGDFLLSFAPYCRRHCGHDVQHHHLLKKLANAVRTTAAAGDGRDWSQHHSVTTVNADCTVKFVQICLRCEWMHKPKH